MARDLLGMAGAMADQIIYRLAWDDGGHALLAYVLVTGLFSVLVLRPELIASAMSRLGDLANLFLSQLGFVF